MIAILGKYRLSPFLGQKSSYHRGLRFGRANAIVPRHSIDTLITPDGSC